MSNDYKWTNDQLIIEELYKDDLPGHPGGRRPQPLKSSWMMRDRQPPPDRATKTTIFIDDLITGDTICEVSDMNAAYDYLKKIHPQRAAIREHIETEQDQQTEDANRRQQQGWLKGFGA